MGFVLIICAVVVSVKNGKNGQGALEWIIFLCGVLLIALSNLLIAD